MADITKKDHDEALAKLQADHKVALSRGGKTTRANLARAHRECNLSAGARLGRETQELRNS